jgi:hypothetical protein
MSARYDRVLGCDAERVLSEGGELRFLIDEVQSLSDDSFALDIQIRKGNKLMYYHGTTCLLTLKFSGEAKGSTMSVTASAADSYRKYQECCPPRDKLMGHPWRLSEISRFKKAWQAYLKATLQGVRSGHYKKEGYWQNRLCLEFGKRWTTDCEWLVVDRECVIGFTGGNEKMAYYEKARKKSLDIKSQLQDAAKKKWGQLDKKGFGDEVDILAVNRAGKLVVIELKHSSYARGIYWGPLQVGVYHRAFKDAPSEVVDGIRRLVNQKIALGLLPKAAKQIASNASLVWGDPVLAVAEPKIKSRCWGQMIEVCERLKQMGEALPLVVAFLQEKNGAIDLHICKAEERALRLELEALR